MPFQEKMNYITADILVHNILPNGKFKLEQKKRAESFVIAFLDILNVQVSQTSRNIIDTGGTSREISTNGGNLLVGGSTAEVGDINKGITVGTGTTTVALTNNKLVTQITHGVTSGKLWYDTMHYSYAHTEGTLALFSVMRIFSNKSGANVTIEEVALYGRGGTSFDFCLDRTLLGSVIADNTSKIITYDIKVDAV